MTITHTVEIACSPENVFAYLDEVTRHPEWQEGLVSTGVVTEGPLRVGSKIAEVRRLGGREQAVTLRDHRARTAADLRVSRP